MKKIGILTFHNAYNYGAVLQCYALQKSITNKNTDVEIINYSNSKIADAYKFFPRNNKSFKSYAKGLVKFFLYHKKTNKRHKNFDEFIFNKFNLSNKYTKEELLKESLEYNCLITGSDQVWNLSIVGELSDIYTLNFGKNNINRISYAASVGDSSLVTKNKDLYEKKLSRLNHISVREEDTKKELEKIIHKPITVVLDPTLLLSKNDWEKEIKNMPMTNERYILAYVVQPNDEYVKIVNDLSKKTGLKVIHFGYRNPGYVNVLKSAYTEGPLEFINYIKNAEYVVATSLHATIFSIIFHKKFFIIPHKKTGSRVTNLLDKLEIKNRISNTLQEFKNIDYNFETNWDSVEQKLEEERKKSLNWLEKSINIGKDSNE